MNNRDDPEQSSSLKRLKRVKVDLDQPVHAEDRSRCQHYLFNLIQPLLDVYGENLYSTKRSEFIQNVASVLDKLSRLLSQPGFLESVCLEVYPIIPDLHKLLELTFKTFEHWSDYKHLFHGWKNLLNDFSNFGDSTTPGQIENLEKICDILATLFWNTGYVKTDDDVAFLKRVYERHPEYPDIPSQSPIDSAPTIRGPGRFWKCIADKIEKKLNRRLIQDELLNVSRIARRAEGTSRMRVPKDIEKYIQSYISSPAREREIPKIQTMKPDDKIKVKVKFIDLLFQIEVGQYLVSRNTTLKELYDLIETHRKKKHLSKEYDRYVWKGKVYKNNSEKTLREIGILDNNVIFLTRSNPNVRKDWPIMP